MQIAQKEKIERYGIRIDKAGKHEVFDKATSLGFVPDCHIDMAAYHAYLMGIGPRGVVQAQVFLASVVIGDKPITAMTICAQSK